MPSNLCPSCGRRPSERVGVIGGNLTSYPSKPCLHWIHDAADAAPEAFALLREVVTFIPGALGSKIHALLARFPEERE